jgi:hypothetical protein
MSGCTQLELDRVVFRLNRRSRTTLAVETPSGRLRAWVLRRPIKTARLTRTLLHLEWNWLCDSRPDCQPVDELKVYSSKVKSQTFRRAPQGRRFLCRKTELPPTSYHDTSVPGEARGALMSENVNVQYVGFEAKALVREYSFIVRRASNETSEFTLTIGNEAFGSRRVRFQDAPEICSLRLHRELAIFGKQTPQANYRISETDLDDYRRSHAPKTAGYPYKP